MGETGLQLKELKCRVEVAVVAGDGDEVAAVDVAGR